MKYPKLQIKLLFRDRMMRIVHFLYHGLYFCLGRLFHKSRPFKNRLISPDYPNTSMADIYRGIGVVGRYLPFKNLFPSTTRKVLGKLQTANSTRPCPGDVYMLLCSIRRLSVEPPCISIKLRATGVCRSAKGMGEWEV